jgi:hypothetical protein
MPSSVVILKSQPGIKRDGTVFEGDFYIDGEWVRFQRGLPRKIRGYKSLSFVLSEVSSALNTFTQGNSIYCHSGSGSYIERFTLDFDGNPSVVTNRTPVAIAATGTVTLTGGASGSVDSITVNGVTITSSVVNFNTNLATTATNVASNINAYTSTPNYTATANGAVITITASTAGAGANGFVVVANTSTITTTTTNMAGGQNAYTFNANNVWMFDVMYSSVSLDNDLIAHVAPNGDNIASSDAGNIYTGNLIGTSPLTEITLPTDGNASGGSGASGGVFVRWGY